jgi:hypothetical protein
MLRLDPIALHWTPLRYIAMTFRKFFIKGVIIIAMIATVGLVIVFVATMQAFDSELQATRSESAVKRSCDPEVLRAWALDLLSREADYETSRPLPHPCLRDIWKSSPSIQIRGAEWGE